MTRHASSWNSHFPARKPAEHWNGWFAIALFEEGPFAWLKTHVFQPASRGRGYPVASLEGFGNAPDVAWMAGMRGLRQPVHASAAVPAVFSQTGVSAGDSRWRWENDELVAEGVLLGRPTRLRASRIGPQAMPWAGIKNFLYYRSLAADMELQWGDECWQGAGLVEHAWGGYLPVPAAQLVPGDWQWDVFWEPGKQRRMYVSLSARWMGLGFVPRAFADDGSVSPVESTPIVVDADDDGIPTVWSGAIDGRSFRAERSGKSLAPFRGGAFFGFLYAMEGRRGVGFSERILSDTKRRTRAKAIVPAYSMR